MKRLAKIRNSGINLCYTGTDAPPTDYGLHRVSTGPFCVYPGAESKCSAPALSVSRGELTLPER